MSVYRETVQRGREGVKVGLHLPFSELALLRPRRGQFFLELRDARTDEVIESHELENKITLDAGILAARLFKDSMEPVPTKNNGLNMLAVGTGATGNLLSPDAPQETQRKLNNEIARKAFTSTQFRTEAGVAVSYPTHIVDFTTTFGESEAVGPLNEMGLISAYDPAVPTPGNPINNGPSNYDPTIDVMDLDLMANYLTFSVVSKPSTAILSITWRLTF